MQTSRRTTTVSANVQGVGFLMLSMLVFSLQDVIVKWVGIDYSVLQIVLLRSLVALPLTVLIYRFEGRRGLPSTKRPGLQYLRGFFLFLSYTTHFMGLAALPLAEIAAIRFSVPLIITALSVLLLGETVGPRRWLALLVGFAGVLLMVRPGAASFNLGSIFILLAALFYAFSVMITRKLQTSDSSATMAYYSSLVYLAAAILLAPLPNLVTVMPDAHPSVAFLLRAWTVPGLLDGLAIAALALIWAAGMYLIARAYSLALASVAAPFEYMSLPISAMWGFLFWREVPSWLTVAGAFLTLASGLYVLYRERKLKSPGLRAP